MVMGISIVGVEYCGKCRNMSHVYRDGSTYEPPPDDLRTHKTTVVR